MATVANDKEQDRKFCEIAREPECDVSEPQFESARSQVGWQKPMIDQGKLRKRMDGLAHEIGKKTE